MQRRQPQPGRAFDEMAAWLEELERRVRALETENQDLRRQLADLRRGVGIALVIEGRTVPVAPLAPSALFAANGTAGGAATGATAGAVWQRPAETPSGPMPTRLGPGHPSYGPAVAGPEAPARASPAESGPIGPTSPIGSALRSSIYAPAPVQPGQAPTRPRDTDTEHAAPRAAPATAHLPVVRPLSSPSRSESRAELHAAWLYAGDEWPDGGVPRESHLSTPAAPVGQAANPEPLTPPEQRPSARPTEATPLARPERELEPGERTPFADSFIL